MMKSMSMDSMPMGMAMDMEAMQDCLMAMNACQMACTMCAGQDMTMGGMEKCAAMCMDMADLCGAAMGMMMRPAGYDTAAMNAMLTACMAMGEACMAECERHASMAECCRYCAMACRDMMAKCEAMMASMQPA